MRDLGKLILGILNEENKSLRWLSRQSGVSNSYLSQMSRGLFTPAPEVLAKLAPHLGITTQRLFEEAGWLNAKSVGAEPPQQREGTLRSIELTEDVYQALLKLVRSFEDTPCDVLRRLLGLHEADEHDSQVGTVVKGQRDYERPVEEMISCLGLEKRGPPKIARVRGATPMAEYALPILEALVEKGVKATQKDVFNIIWTKRKHRFNELDLEVLRDGYTPRWQKMAAWQGYRMKERGLLCSDSPRGTWEITEGGRQHLASMRNSP